MKYWRKSSEMSILGNQWDCQRDNCLIHYKNKRIFFNQSKSKDMPLLTKKSKSTQVDLKMEQKKMKKQQRFKIQGVQRKEKNELII